MPRLPDPSAPLTPRARSAWMAAAVAALSLLGLTLAGAGWLAWRNAAAARVLAASAGPVGGSGAAVALAPAGPALTAAGPAAWTSAMPPALLALAVLAACLALVCGVVLMRRPQGAAAAHAGPPTLPPPHEPEPGELVLRRVSERARPAGFTGSAELARLQQALAALQVGVRDLPANPAPAATVAAGAPASTPGRFAAPARAAATLLRGASSPQAGAGTATGGARAAVNTFSALPGSGAKGAAMGGMRSRLGLPPARGALPAGSPTGMADAPRPLQPRAGAAVPGLSPLAGAFGGLAGGEAAPGRGAPATAKAAGAAVGRPGTQALVDAAQRAIDTVGELAARLEEIGQVSRRIVDGVGVIEGIALQSSTLALQASLDAARAGDRGRASGAVAADIRLLGQKAAHAAREIHGLVSPVLLRLQQGAGLGDSSQTLRNMLDLLQGATELLAASTASADAADVGEALARVEALSREQAGLARQAGGVAEGLRLQAERLHKVAQAFRQLQQTQEAAWAAQCAITDARRSARMAALPASAADPRADEAPPRPLPKPGGSPPV